MASNEIQSLELAKEELEIGDWQSELLGGRTGKIEFPDTVINLNNTWEYYSETKALSILPKTDQRAADLIVEKFKDYIHYEPKSQTWYFWNGKIHRPCSGDTIAQALIKLFQEKVSQAISMLEFQKDIDISKKKLSEEDTKKAWADFGKKLKKYKDMRDRLASSAGRFGIASMLKHDIHVAIEIDHFLDDRRWLVVENGVFDLEDIQKNRRFVRLEHDRSRPVYRKLTFVDDPGASNDVLEKFISESIQDESMGRYLQKIMGTAVFGVTSDVKTFVSLQGATNSGKSMIFRIIEEFDESGTFAVQPASVAITGADNSKEAQQGRYPMIRGRVCMFSEVYSKLNKSFLLKYTGYDKYDAQEKYIATTNQRAAGIIFIASNKPLNIDKTDDATFKRLKPIMFPHQFIKPEVALPGERIEDNTLQRRIIEQGSGVFKWLKEGYLMALEEGWSASESMEKVRLDEREEADEITYYLEDRLEKGVLVEVSGAPESHYVSVGKLYSDYLDWAKYSGSGSTLKRNEVVEKVERFYPKVQKKPAYFDGLKMEKINDYWKYVGK